MITYLNMTNNRMDVLGDENRFAKIFFYLLGRILDAITLIKYFKG